MNICCICGRPYKDYGNNAWPVKDGRCCNECNSNAVIPTRILMLYLRKNYIDERKNEE